MFYYTFLNLITEDFDHKILFFPFYYIILNLITEKWSTKFGLDLVYKKKKKKKKFGLKN